MIRNYQFQIARRQVIYYIPNFKLIHLISKKLIFFIVSCLLLTTLPAYANGLPAYFGTAMFHIMVINLFVIIAEFLLLSRLSGTTVLLKFIIIANLTSLFLAYPFTDFFVHSLHIKQWFGLSKSGTITKSIFLLGAAIFLVLTIFIEWLFFYLSTKREKGLMASLKLTAIINLLTNIPIAAFYIFTNAYQPTPD